MKTRYGRFSALRILTALVACAMMPGFVAPIGSSAQSPRSVSPKLAAGDLDPTFGDGGKVVTGGGLVNATSTVVQPDGKVLVAGGARGGALGWQFAVVRYNVDGNLDASFGAGGRVTTNIGGDGAWAVALRPDGRIVVAGTNGSKSEPDGFSLAQYNSDGSLDNSFGTGGTVTTRLPRRSFGLAEVVQADGKIVVAGSSADGMTLIRYTMHGDTDQSFGTGGKVTVGGDITTGPAFDFAYAVVSQDDGKIVVAGAADHQTSPTSTTADFGLARFNSDGSLDTTFGNNGTIDTAVGDFSIAFDLLAQPDGRIIAAGMGGVRSSQFALARYNANGSLDTSFGEGGIVTTPIGQFANAGASAIALQGDGRIVAVGDADIQTGPADLAVARFNADGTIDSAFGSGGTTSTDFGIDDYGHDVALQADGKIIAVAMSDDGFKLTRYLASTSPTVGVGGSYSGVEGAAVALSGSVSDPDSPGVTHKWSVVPGSGVDSGTNCFVGDPAALSTSVVCTDDGEFTVTLTADDGVNPPVSDSTTLTVGNADPTVTISAPDDGVLVTRGSTVTVTAPFTDASNDEHSCTVDFDDGTPSVAGVVTQAHGHGVCSASHAIATVGAHQVKVAVIDDDGGTGSAAVKVVSYLRGGAFGLQATGPITVAKTPNVSCPPNDSKTTATLRTPIASVHGLTASCQLDPATGATTATAAVTDVTALGVRISGIDSTCTATATGNTASSHVGTINGIKIGTQPGTIGIPGVAEIHYNETITTPAGLTHNAIRIRTLLGETITLASCQLG